MSTGRAPGAHRARKSEGRVPRFRRVRGQDGGTQPAAPGPYPADLPVSSEAGLTADGYGLTAEGELAEAELARADTTSPRSTATQERDGGPSLVRSSGVMAVGTLASRLTGFVRSAVLIFALGQVWLGNAYNYANSLPNTVYNLAIGGILTSVIVPLLVNAAKRDNDRGEFYTQRMFTLVTIVLAVITVAATFAAGPIADLYGCAKKNCSMATPLSANYHHLLVIFAYFFIPQIFFYGISSLAGAVLNARGHFAAPMWTPVVNNIVVIVISLMFMAIAGFSTSVARGHITTSEIWLLGVGTTLGIIAQTAALVPALRRVGFRWRPRFDFRRSDIAEIGRMAGWMFGYVVTTQIAYLITAKVAATVPQHIVAAGKDFTAYSYAWLLFQLPYAIVGISVITALLPRMSAHASERRYDLVRSDFSTGIRLGSVIVAPAALILAVIGPPLAEVLFAYGTETTADSRYLGLVFSVFSVGLMPYMLFQLLLRVFYSLHDSRTPALIGVVTMITNVTANLLALTLASPGNLMAALGIGFGLSNSVGAVLAWYLLSKRIGGLGGRQIGASLARMHAAAIPAVLFAVGVTLGLTAEFSTRKLFAAVIVVVAGGGALLLYVWFAKALRVREVADLTDMVRTRLRR
jgi:putative peptidoglycan lipid II flippase